MAYAYILKSLKDGKLYYGSSENLSQRLKDHNAGKVTSTKSRRPLVLHYFEEWTTKEEAGKRERCFKSLAGYRWLQRQGIISNR